MADSIWYASYTNGQPPYCKRLIRAPDQVRWMAAPHLALSLAVGNAEYRSLTMQRPASPPETHVYWPDAPWPSAWDLRADGLTPMEIAAATGMSLGTIYRTLEQPPSAWWIVPVRTIRQAEALIRMATQAAGHRTGTATPELIGRQLHRWLRSGRWRRQLYIRAYATETP